MAAPPEAPAGAAPRQQLTLLQLRSAALEAEEFAELLRGTAPRERAAAAGRPPRGGAREGTRAEERAAQLGREVEQRAAALAASEEALRRAERAEEGLRAQEQAEEPAGGAGELERLRSLVLERDERAAAAEARAAAAEARAEAAEQEAEQMRRDTAAAEQRVYQLEHSLAKCGLVLQRTRLTRDKYAEALDKMGDAAKRAHAHWVRQRPRPGAAAARGGSEQRRTPRTPPQSCVSTLDTLRGTPPQSSPAAPHAYQQQPPQGSPPVFSPPPYQQQHLPVAGYPVPVTPPPLPP